MRYLTLIAALLCAPVTVLAQCPPIVSQFQSSSSFNAFSAVPVQSFGFNAVQSVGCPPIVSSNVFLSRSSFAVQPLFLATPTVFVNTAVVRNRAVAANVNVNVRNRGVFANRQVVRQRTVIRR